MSDKKEAYRGASYRRQRSQELKAGLPLPEFPETSKIGIKQIVFLHAYCREQPHEIAARYPKCLTLADVHLALAHYFRDREPIDSEIKREIAFNRRDGLESSTVSLPRVGLSSLVDVA
jgi:hypothetical protein